MNIYWLDSTPCHDVAHVGGKAANLGRLAAKFPVPPGFCLTTATPNEQLISTALYESLAQAYQQLGARCGRTPPAVAVRSSAVDEDGTQASFAGQHETYLNVIGVPAVAEAVQRCWASALTDRALIYRSSRGLGGAAGIAVLVQQLIAADVSAIAFSVDPCTNDQDHIVINANWGLGESLVGGLVTPDLFVVRKSDLAIVERRIAVKQWLTVRNDSGTHEVLTPRVLQQEPSLNDKQVLAVARMTRALEVNEDAPVDVECAWQDERLYLLQCRPITTLRRSGSIA